MEQIVRLQSFLIEIYLVSRFATPKSWQEQGFEGYAAV